ncbi:MAG: hypothetical protein ABIT37_01605 [Luteolibacter sp.]
MALDLDKLIGTLRECGCCTPPECCAPLIECQSGFARAYRVGFHDPGSDSYTGSDYAAEAWRRTRYLRSVAEQHGISLEPSVVEYPSGGGTYTESTLEADWVIRFIMEYDQGFSAATAGAYFSFGDCERTDAVATDRCEYSGGWTSQRFYPYDEGDGWANYLGWQEIGVLDDASGELDPAWTAWEAAAGDWDTAHPDYPGEVADYEAAHATWETDYAAYVVAYDAWVEGGSVEGEEPVAPVEPTAPDARPPEPAKYYPPCTMRSTITVTLWERSGGETVLIEDTEEAPNPSTTIVIPGSVAGDNSPSVVNYESPVTIEEWIALVEEWISPRANFDHAEGSDSLSCPPGNLCRATKAIGDNRSWLSFTGDYHADWFRFRIKLNKCCAWTAIRSEWVRVAYPAVWLDWLGVKNSTEGSDPVPPEPEEQPEKLVQAWTWTGTPPRCDESDSGSDANNPFDEEAMWSPFSLVIRLPDGADHQGIIANRNYKQKCYAAPFQAMEEVFGTYEHESESV